MPGKHKQGKPAGMAKKSLGQNFLMDERLLYSLVEATPVTKDARVVEIGAGLGTLTKVLSESCAELVSYEIDDQLVPLLRVQFEKDAHVRIVHEDILKANLNTLFGGKDYHIVANIPYYLTTELMEKLLIVPGKDLVSVSLMVQKEAGERISALPGSKLYGPLSVLASFYGTPRIVRVVDRKCFTPAPDVDSCFITLPMRRSRISALSEADMRRFYRFVRIAFSKRRKTLLNNLLPSFPERDKLETLFREAGLGPAIRAEQLDPECLYFLAQRLGRD